MTSAVTVDGWEGTGRLEPLAEFLRTCGPVDAVGHPPGRTSRSVVRFWPLGRPPA